MRKRRQWKEWTPKDERELRSLSRNYTPLRKVARVTGRTPGALRQKAFSMGIGLGANHRG